MASPSAEALPLAGRRILITRAAHQMGKLSEGLRALGAEPVEVPMLEICPPESLAPLDAALRRLNEYDWLILTSTNTVRVLAVRAAEQGIDLTHRMIGRVAAIGGATADAARKAGFTVALVPDTYVAESLVSELTGEVADGSSAEGKSPIAGKQVLLVRAAVARDVIPNALRRAGATVDIAEAYRNVLPQTAPELLRAALKTHIDAVTFSSTTTVMHFAETTFRLGIRLPLRGIAAVSVGPITSQTLRELGWEPAAEASPSDIPGLIDAVLRVLSTQASERHPLPPC
ncbi:MAG TPA: uroporphyrinogen-III synthase [Terracidiphilus sp.]|nr:uroporphyrinogen-III synthase [Terracidiphilus sp.]